MYNHNARPQGDRALRYMYKVLLIVMPILFVAWQTFNYATSEGGLATIFGPGLIAAVLAVVIVGMDVVFVSVSFLRGVAFRGRHEGGIMDVYANDPVMRSMAFAWGLVTVIDTFLSWLVLATYIEARQAAGLIQAPSSILPYIHWMALIIAVVSAILAAAVVLITSSVVNWLGSQGQGGGGTSQPRRKNKGRTKTSGRQKQTPVQRPPVQRPPVQRPSVQRPIHPAKQTPRTKTQNQGPLWNPQAPKQGGGGSADPLGWHPVGQGPSDPPRRW